MPSEPTWPGVEHALAKAAELLTLAESVDSEQARTACYVADSWRALAVDAAGLRRDEPSVGDPRYGGSRLRQPAAPEPPLLTPGTMVRIPGIDVPFVVDKGLATSGANASLTFTTVDGRDWSDDRTVNAAAGPAAEDAAPRREKSIRLRAETEEDLHRCGRALRAYGAPLDQPFTLEPSPVNVAAEPKDPALFQGGLRGAGDRLGWPVSSESAENIPLYAYANATTNAVGPSGNSTITFTRSGDDGLGGVREPVNR